MRLHRLEVTAFGPFAGSHSVDLEALSQSGLFLIHGPTGAGKTSILDAICFALYAAVPGARSGARAGLRSDHAAEDAVPEVSLEFTSSGRRLRVTRSPEFSRPKKRGTGLTKVQARVVLEELIDGEWLDRGTRNDEVALVIHDVIGMGLEQFVKVVLLPQGDFAAFLRANPEERRAVLERLFDTSRFTDIEEWLSARRRTLSAGLSAARTELATGLLRVDDTLARLEQAEDLEHPAWDDLPTTEVGGVLSGLVAAVDTRASAAIAAMEMARSTHAGAETALHEGRRVAEHQRTAARARADLAALESQRDVYVEAARRVAQARRAAVVQAHLDNVDHCRSERASAAAAVVARREPLATVSPAAGLGPDATAEDVRACVALVDQHSPGLSELSALVRRAQEQRTSAAAHERTATRHRQELADLTGALSAVTAELATNQAALELARQGAAGLGSAVARQEMLARVESLTKELQESEARLPGLQHALDSATSVTLTAREHLLTLRERRLAGMASELASALATGDPCPVCGACEHPAPAQGAVEVTPEDIVAAEREVDIAGAAQSRAQDALTAELSAQRTRTEALHREACDVAADDLARASAEAAGQVARARAAAATLATTGPAVEQLAARAEELRTALERTGRDHDAARALGSAAREQASAALAEAAVLLQDHAEACPCAASDPAEGGELDTGVGAAVDASAVGAVAADAVAVDAVAAAAAPAAVSLPRGRVSRQVAVDAATVHEHMSAAVTRRHVQVGEQLDRLLEALRDLAAAERSTSDAEQRLESCLREQGFATVDDARAALLPQEEVATFEHLLAQTDRCRNEAEALLRQPEVAAAAELPAPDLEALGTAHERAGSSLQEASRRHTLTEQAEGELRRLGASIHASLAALGPAEAEHALVTELADCVTGTSANNSLRMRLSSYILAARLEEVARLANERLAHMSDGRYALEYTDALAARGARSGLGLRVRDAWTGLPRDTASLSGGEAFMASLALALGLGDAVRAEAGGFDLQTLFVDEGFGTLDEESLEQVMAVLDTLREGGRAVGIVSHVAELRQRIPVQLRVTKTPRGSEVTVSLDDEAAA